MVIGGLARENSEQEFEAWRLKDEPCIGRQNHLFDLFSIEVPNAPFGLAWYIGDIVTDANGIGVGNFVGRFNIETFVISPGIPTTPPPNVFPSPPAVVPEATVGVKTNPVQLYHLGLWFNSASDAANAGCSAAPTPFNGEHNAGTTLAIPIDAGGRGRPPSDQV